MSGRSLLRDQRGVALIAALFLLVVLAALGVYMVTMSGVESRTPVFALQGARAFEAARSGVEWGIYQAEQQPTPACSASTTFPVGDFSVTVNCSQQPAAGTFKEGPLSYHVYQLSALAELGSYGSADYVSRQVETRVTGP